MGALPVFEFGEPEGVDVEVDEVFVLFSVGEDEAGEFGVVVVVVVPFFPCFDEEIVELQTLCYGP